LPAFLVAALALATNPAQAEMKSQWVEYTHGDTKLKAYMVYDDQMAGRRPAVLMIHAREGMTPKTLQLAQTWAKLGYVSFAADIFGYGQGVLPKDVAEMQAQTAIYTKDRTLMRARTQAGFDALVKNPMVDASKVALIGYCFGGAVGVEFGATGAPLVANVSIHGSFRDHEEGWAKNAKGMYLILHGAEDGCQAMIWRSKLRICTFSVRNWAPRARTQARAIAGSRLSLVSATTSSSCSTPLRPTGATMPNSARCARIALTTAVCWRMNR